MVQPLLTDLEGQTRDLQRAVTSSTTGVGMPQRRRPSPTRFGWAGPGKAEPMGCPADHRPVRGAESDVPIRIVCVIDPRLGEKLRAHFRRDPPGQMRPRDIDRAIDDVDVDLGHREDPQRLDVDGGGVEHRDRERGGQHCTGGCAQIRTQLEHILGACRVDRPRSRPQIGITHQHAPACRPITLRIGCRPPCRGGVGHRAAELSSRSGTVNSSSNVPRSSRWVIRGWTESNSWCNVSWVWP